MESASVRQFVSFVRLCTQNVVPREQYISYIQMESKRDGLDDRVWTADCAMSDQETS